MLSNPDRYLSNAVSTKATAEPHMGQGQAAYQAYAREEAQKAAEQAVKDAEEREPTRITREQKQEQNGDKGEKPGSHAPAEDAHDVPVNPDEKGSSESESKSAMEQKYGKPGEGKGSRQREQSSTVAQQAVERERRDQQRRRAVRNTVQRQNEADLGPEM